GAGAGDEVGDDGDPLEDIRAGYRQRRTAGCEEAAHRRGELGSHLPLVPPAPEGRPGERLPIRPRRSEEDEALAQDAHRALVPVDDRRHAAEEAEAPLPVQFAPRPPRLVMTTVVDLARLGDGAR